MKVIITFLIYGCVVNVLNSQENKALDIYYKNLYKAEDFIVESKYDSSLVYYNKAFSMYPENFVADLNNALVCAIELDSFDLINFYINELLLQGVSKSYFTKKYYFNKKVFNSPHWFQILDEPIYTRINKIKVNLIDSLVELDQYPRRNNLPDSIFLKVDKVNEQILEKYIFNNCVFPSSYEIGVRMVNDTIIYGYPLSTLLIHQVRDNPSKYSGIFEYNLNKKAINPKSYFFYSKLFMPREKENLLGCDDGTFLIIEYFGDEAFTCCCELKELVNKNRKRYYLEDIDKVIAKYEFSKSCTLPFIFDNDIEGHWTPLDHPKIIDRRNKRLADPNYIRFIEKKR
ncbi:MAG TPA: hypothetical protein PKA44_04800 [Saprospiraceae bacterium]|nr:hypothetical protein [Saprospiraceae bacterium]